MFKNPPICTNLFFETLDFRYQIAKYLDYTKKLQHKENQSFKENFCLVNQKKILFSDLYTVIIARNFRPLNILFCFVFHHCGSRRNVFIVLKMAPRGNNGFQRETLQRWYMARSSFMDFPFGFALLLDSTWPCHSSENIRFALN